MTAETATLGVLRRRRLVDDVVGVLREQIVRGQLPAGAQLLQTDLAARLGVSRTPLREALRILENDGWVRTSNNNRTVEVVTFDAAELRALFELREVIDGLAARLATRRGLPPAVHTEARRLLDEMAASAAPYDPLRRADAHAAFHLLFVEQSGNQRLRALIPLIRVSTAALYLPFLDDPDAVTLVVNAAKTATPKQLFDETQASHQAILDAVTEGHATRAEAAARRHIRRTLDVVDSFDEWRRIIADAASHHPHPDEGPATPRRP